MQRMHRVLVSLFLGASLIGPVVMQARDHDHDKRERERRYYDRQHRDYHAWDAREQGAYRHWLMEERHERTYRTYPALERERQAEYWRWRHEHPNWR
jgi:hypothetical protein